MKIFWADFKPMFISFLPWSKKETEPKKEVQDFSMQLDGKGSIILYANIKSNLFTPSR